MPLSTARKTGFTFLLIILLGLSADAAEIRLKGTVHSHRSLVLLGDIADVKDDNADVVRTLERIELFPAPSTRQGRTLRLGELRELLRLNGVDLAACQFAGPEICRVMARRAEEPRAAFLSKPVVPPAAGNIMLVAARPLHRGHVVSESDVMPRSVTDSTNKLAALRGGRIIQEMHDVVGYELTRPQPANQPFDSSMLRRPLLVRQGEVVRVTAQASGVNIRTSARAMEAGSQGDVIMLQTGEKKFLARVTGLQQAEVYAAGLSVQSASAEPVVEDRVRAGRGRRSHH